MLKNKLRQKKLICIFGIKGGIGKSHVSLLIIKHLISENKKVVIYELDSTNAGLSFLIYKNIRKDIIEKQIKIIRDNPHKFFTCIDKKIGETIFDYDYGIIDGFMDPLRIDNFYKKVNKYILKVLFIISDDESINPESIKINLRNYMLLLRNKMSIIFNNKNNVLFDSYKSRKMSYRIYKEVLKNKNNNLEYLESIKIKLSPCFEIDEIPKFLEKEIPYLENMKKINNLNEIVFDILKS